jgi:hypothetical protein
MVALAPTRQSISLHSSPASSSAAWQARAASWAAVSVLDKKRRRTPVWRKVLPFGRPRRSSSCDALTWPAGTALPLPMILMWRISKPDSMFLKLLSRSNIVNRRRGDAHFCSRVSPAAPKSINW